MTRLLLLLLACCWSAALQATDVFFTTTSGAGSEATPGTPVVLTVGRFPTSGGLTVNFTIVDTDTQPELRATVVDDFTTSPAVTTTGTLVFADQEASKTITITVVNDSDIEGREYARVTLTSGAGYSVNGAASSSVITIADDDVTVTVDNLFTVATEDPSLSSPNHDPGAGRRGVMQLYFDAATSFDKTALVTFAGTAGAADYKLSYRIGGGGLGSGLGWEIAAYSPGVDTITIKGDTEPIPAGTDVTIAGETYVVKTAFPGISGGQDSGNLELTTDLTTSVLHGAPITVDGVAGAIGYVVARTFQIGEKSMILAEDSGHLPAPRTGDVFSFGGNNARYVITTDPTADGTFTFRRYEGGTTDNDGLDVAITTTQSMQVMFPQTAPGQFGVLVPGESTRVQFAVVPGDGTNANDGIVEGRESVTLGLALSDDFFIGSTATGAVTIADVDSKASIALGRNAVHPHTTGIATVTLTPPIPQDIEVPFSILPSGSAAPGDYIVGGNLSPSGNLIIPRNTATGDIIITSTTGATIPVGGDTVVVQLGLSQDYQRTTGPVTSAVATVTILPTTGTVTVARTDGAEGGANGNFRLSIARFSGQTGAVTVDYTISGTATATDDYTPALSGSVIIPAAPATHVDIPVTIVNDSAVEGDETIILTIDPDDSYVVGTADTATLTITDNEPVVSVSTLDSQADEGGGTGSFRISLTPAPSTAITVPFVLTGAADGQITAAPASSVGFSPTDVGPKDVIITAVDDTTVIGSRTLTLTLSDPATPPLYALGSAKTATLTVADNDTGVSGVSASTADGAYGLGAEISITVTCTATVTVGGTPVLALATGSTTRHATYLSGSGSDTLVFRYVVQAGDVSSDLDYTSSSALSLNGGSLTAGGQPLVLTLPMPGTAGSLGASKALIINGGGGKPPPGALDNSSGGGCGLGSGVATLLGLCMLAGFALSIRRIRA